MRRLSEKIEENPFKGAVFGTENIANSKSSAELKKSTSLTFGKAVFFRSYLWRLRDQQFGRMFVNVVFRIN